MCARVFVRVRVYMCVRESVPVYVLARVLYIFCLFVFADLFRSARGV